MESKQECIQTNVEPVANCDQLAMPIENRILTFRGKPVMIDRDLAELYGVETKRLNEQVKRNIDRFPESFRFQLNDSEKNSTSKPFAFTEQGVAMLSAVKKFIVDKTDLPCNHSE